MIEGIGYGTYIFFACFCGLAAIWAYLLVPEVIHSIFYLIKIVTLTLS